MKIISRFPFWIGLLVCCAGAACNKSSTAPFSRPVVLPSGSSATITATQQFAFDFFRAQLQTNDTAVNKLVSPLSIYFALAMTYNGAAHATRDSIQKTLRLTTNDTIALNETLQALASQLPNADSRVQLSIANAIWYNSGYLSPLPGFANTMSRYFGAGLRPLNFSDAAGVDVINQWASDQTHQKIPKILDGLSGDILMYLLNAIYFKGSWQYQFNKNATALKPFRLANNTVVNTPFMSMKADLNYFSNDSVSVVELPYGSGNFSMTVLLPHNNGSVTDFAQHLQAGNFYNWQSQLRKQTLQLFLPRFSYSYSIDKLQPALSQLGMRIAFSDFADFSNMYTVPAQINKALHKTFIEVTEEGTTAAAVTAIGIELTNAAPVPVLSIDHPFVYLITEKTSNTILFIGTVGNPAL